MGVNGVSGNNEIKGQTLDFFRQMDSDPKRAKAFFEKAYEHFAKQAFQRRSAYAKRNAVIYNNNSSSKTSNKA